MQPVSFRLDGKIALVTGAGRGIGRTLAIGLAQAGADVILTARTQPEIESAAKEITELTGRKTLALTCDVSDPASIESTVNKAIEEFGRIDILVNNAGVGFVKSMLDLTVEEWDHVMNINLRAAFLMSKAVGPHMINQKWGRIINMASFASSFSLKGLNAYTPSKAGVASLTTQFANEWAPFGITVNSISPWFFRTSMNGDSLDVEPMLSYSKNGTPMGRTGNLEELVAPVLFFCSEGASFVNGQNLFVDGGASIMGL